MTKQKEALELALEALENLYDTCDWQGDDGKEAWLNAPKAITAIKEALAQPEPEQEPVAWRTFDGEGGYDYCSHEDNESYADDWNKRNPNHKGWVDKLYTHSQRTWVDLTRTQMQDVYFAVLEEHRGGHQMEGQLAFGEALQAKLKERNT